MREYWFLIAISGGCSTEPLSSPKNNNPAAAVLRRTEQFVVFAYTDQEHRSRLPQIADGELLKEFRWVRFEIAPSVAERMYSADGLRADLKSADAGVSIQQVYPGTCNPALADFSDCWLYERLDPGVPEVTGTLQIISEKELFSGGFETSWEGYTDRFGEPIQWGRHGTSAQFRAQEEVP